MIDEEDEVDEKDDLGVIIMNIGFDKFLFWNINVEDVFNVWKLEWDLFWDEF